MVPIMAVAPVLLREFEILLLVTNVVFPRCAPFSIGSNKLSHDPPPLSACSFPFVIMVELYYLFSPFADVVHCIIFLVAIIVVFLCQAEDKLVF